MSLDLLDRTVASTTANTSRAAAEAHPESLSSRTVMGGNAPNTAARPEPMSVTLKHDPSAWIAPVLDTLNRMLQLPAGWDSYGARPISPRAALATAEFLDEFMHLGTPLPFLVPTNRGGVQVEWHTRGFDIEAEVGSGGLEYAYCEDLRGGREWEWSPGDDRSPLTRFLTELSARQ
jgi:hypothetical protein